MNRILRGTRTWSLRFPSLNYPVLKNTKVMISQLPASHKPFCRTHTFFVENVHFKRIWTNTLTAQCTLQFSPCCYVTLLCTLYVYSVHYAVMQQCVHWTHSVCLPSCYASKCTLFTMLFYCNVWRMCTIYNYHHVYGDYFYQGCSNAVYCTIHWYLPWCFTAMYDVCVQYTIITMCNVTISIRVVRTLYIVLYTDIYQVVLLQCMTYVYNIQLPPCVTRLFLSELSKQIVLQFPNFNINLLNYVL